MAMSGGSQLETVPTRCSNFRPNIRDVDSESNSFKRIKCPTELIGMHSGAMAAFFTSPTYNLLA